MDIMQSIKEALSAPKTQPNVGASDSLKKDTNAETFLSKAKGDGTYKVEEQNWYSAKPYGFRANMRDGKTTITMFLPINPSNLTINTSFATNIVTTLYGTVEEHSDVRYFDISIEGTTGMAPKFVSPSFSPDSGTAFKETRKSGRSTASVVGAISAGGFLARTMAAINQLKQKAADLAGSQIKAQTGLIPENSGYVAFHNLYRFLLKYKKDAAGVEGSGLRKRHPLTFFNYKDNNEYDVAVRNFTLRRSADNPMLYYYSIQLRGYNLRGISKQVEEDLTKRFADLGLNGVQASSSLGEMKSIASQAKSIIGSAIGGINIFGR
jgi:hypothetical protein